jgi:SAM-dependent methyltransferase
MAVDPLTIKAYNDRASEFGMRYRALAPTDLQEMAGAFFHQGEPTADIGCGSGRDAAWLRDHGFPTVGYDASPEMLAHARAAYPNLEFHLDSLPDLATISPGSYSNVLCCAVLMHIRREDLITAALALARVLKPGGRLLLTYRHSQGQDEREPDGRLFTAIPSGKLILLLESAGFRVVMSTQQADTTRANVRWFVLLAEKSPPSAARGLDRIQAILAQDRKTATYKFALIRALCHISRTQAHLVHWGEEQVHVPLWSIAIQWLIYYWPLVNAPTFIAQLRGENPESPKPLAFRGVITSLAQQYGLQGLWALLRDIDTHPHRFEPALRVIARTVEAGPVKYAGSARTPVFGYRRRIQTNRQATHLIGSFGWVAVPESVWLDLSRFDHWIEDSIVVRWAQLSAEMNPASTVSELLPLLLSVPNSEHDTQEVRNLLSRLAGPLRCVWTDQPIRHDIHVDHVIPFSVWGNNDLWNLLPSVARVNLAKKDALPSLALIQRRSECIIGYWREYQALLPGRFDFQISRALGCNPQNRDWEHRALAGLRETMQKLAATRGLAMWEP